MNGIIVVCGLPGVGKTTFARWLAEDLDAEHLRTDVVRKEMYEDPTYTNEETESVYDELLARSTNVLAEGGGVVLDGTYRKQKHRYQVTEYAEKHRVPCLFYKVECDRDVVQQRLSERTNDASDADFDIHQRLTFDKLERPHAIVDNTDEEPNWTEIEFLEDGLPAKPAEQIDPDEYHVLFENNLEAKTSDD